MKLTKVTNQPNEYFFLLIFHICKHIKQTIHPDQLSAFLTINVGYKIVFPIFRSKAKKKQIQSNIILTSAVSELRKIYQNKPNSAGCKIQSKFYKLSVVTKKVVCEHSLKCQIRAVTKKSTLRKQFKCQISAKSDILCAKKLRQTVSFLYTRFIKSIVRVYQSSVQKPLFTVQLCIDRVENKYEPFVSLFFPQLKQHFFTLKVMQISCLSIKIIFCKIKTDCQYACLQLPKQKYTNFIEIYV
eukprot:TRINITY_DN7131_c0_g1_i2.p1 TRINITY_DN7131_c0_g1~~TRINITY_DN7131_c0_g1_i2.p1  ORF type:complete len:242 (-),score=-13.17 TRINITY_DN7131_c0_g1_i2:56-781(-)